MPNADKVRRKSAIARVAMLIGRRTHNWILPSSAKSPAGSGDSVITGGGKMNVGEAKDTEGPMGEGKHLTKHDLHRCHISSCKQCTGAQFVRDLLTLAFVFVLDFVSGLQLG